MSPHRSHNPHFGIFFAGVTLFALAAFFLLPLAFATGYSRELMAGGAPLPPTLDKVAYDKGMLALAHIDLSEITFDPTPRIATASTTSPAPPLLLATTTPSTSIAIVGKLWPKAAAYPNYGALLPSHRIVAYYGNFYSKGMGVLGEYPTKQMLQMLASTTAEWQAADPTTKTIPAIDYIAVTAQAAAGRDGKYRARMPDDQIEKALALAEAANGIVVLDVQVGLSTLQDELPALEQFLKLPQVHLAIDPEFSIKTKSRPGLVIGTFDAADVNYATTYLASLVDQYHLPPKILVIHRFTKDMVTGYQDMKPLPEVQIVMDMDGFGPQYQKIDTYNYITAPEPVQFTGFKLFYKNDIPPRGDKLLTPGEIINLTPAPVFIQYQ